MVIEDDRKGSCCGRPRNPGGRDEDGVERDVDRDPAPNAVSAARSNPVMIKRIGPVRMRLRRASRPRES